MFRFAFRAWRGSKVQLIAPDALGQDPVGLSPLERQADAGPLELGADREHVRVVERLFFAAPGKPAHEAGHPFADEGAGGDRAVVAHDRHEPGRDHVQLDESPHFLLDRLAHLHVVHASEVADREVDGHGGRRGRQV